MSDVIGAIIAFVPILVILWLANMAERLRAEEEPYGAPALMAYGLLGILYGMGVLAGLILQLTGVIATQQLGLLQELSGGNERTRHAGFLAAAGVRDLAAVAAGVGAVASSRAPRSGAVASH